MLSLALLLVFYLNCVQLWLVSLLFQFPWYLMCIYSIASVCILCICSVIPSVPYVISLLHSWNSKCLSLSFGFETVFPQFLDSFLLIFFFFFYLIRVNNSSATSTYSQPMFGVTCYCNPQHFSVVQ